VGYTTALQQDWSRVQSALEVPGIDAPAPLDDPKELFDLCLPEGELESGAAAARSLVARVNAASVKLDAERARWVGQRDVAIKACEASGWRRQHP
jgi:hypothetical protein